MEDTPEDKPEDRQHRSTLRADVAHLRSLLEDDFGQSGLTPSKPRLLMLAGLPGSGKSRFSRDVSSRHPFLVLESDRLRKALVAKPRYTRDEHSRVFSACHWLIDEFLEQGYPVLLDATNSAQRNRRPILAIAHRRNVPLAIVVLTAPPDVVQKRLQAREAGLDPATWSDAGWDVYARMAPAWQPVEQPHIVVDTSGDTTEAVAKILDWAAS